MIGRFLFYLARSVILFFSPFVIILLSITWGLTSPSLHKSTLRGSGIYSAIAKEIQDTKINDTKNHNISDFILTSSGNQIVSSGWVQNVIEKNIDNITDWFRGDVDDIVLYIPTEDINFALEQELDRQVSAYIEEGNVKVCNRAQEASINSNGYELEEDFCLPRPVFNQEQTLTNYLDTTGKANLLDELITSDRLDIENNTYTLKIEEEFEFLKTLQDITVTLRNYLWVISAVIAFLIISLVIWTWILKMNIWKEARFIGWSILTTTLVISVSVVLFFAFSGYLTRFTDDILNTDIVSSDLFDVLGQALLRIIFNLFLMAIIVSIILLFWVVVLWIGEKIEKSKYDENKNKKLKDHSQDYSKFNNQTADSQFHRMRMEKKDNPGMNELVQDPSLNKEYDHSPYENNPYTHKDPNDIDYQTVNPTNIDQNYKVDQTTLPSNQEFSTPNSNPNDINLKKAEENQPLKQSVLEGETKSKPPTIIDPNISSQNNQSKKWF